MESPTCNCDIAARQYCKRKLGLRIGVGGCKAKDYQHMYFKQLLMLPVVHRHEDEHGTVGVDSI